MRIIKCLDDISFDAFRRGNVRIGSLRYYKMMEDPARADGKEGPIAIQIKGHETEGRNVSADEFNRISMRAGNSFRIKGIRFALKNGASILLDSTANIFVFCASRFLDGDQALGDKFGNHFIEIFDIQGFVKAVSNVLSYEVFRKKSLVLKGDADSFAYRHQKVTYGNKDPIDSDSAVEDTELPYFNLDEVFLKPEEYISENEYRFIWFPHFKKNGTMCSLPYDFKYLDIHVPRIDRFCRIVSEKGEILGALEEIPFQRY